MCEYDTPFPSVTVIFDKRKTYLLLPVLLIRWKYPDGCVMIGGEVMSTEFRNQDFFLFCCIQIKAVAL